MTYLETSWVLRVESIEWKFAARDANKDYFHYKVTKQDVMKLVSRVQNGKLFNSEELDPEKKRFLLLC